MAQLLQEIQDLVVDALNVVEFKLIRKRSDLDDDKLTFPPMMAHQIFGEAESIFGYKDLRVRILYTAGPLYIYVGIEYSAKAEEMGDSDMKADNVVATIGDKLPMGCYFVNMDEFLKTLDKADKFKPFGEKLSEYKHIGDDGSERHFEIFHSDYKASAFLKFFARLQTFILWFVDAASYIDVDDMQWGYFICYEKYTNENGGVQFATVGYTTVYEYFAYPEHIRPRISQMLVLPPFQRLGIGTNFLETIYKFYQAQGRVKDITVEDPSDDFQYLRNCVDARLCLNLKSFAKGVIKKGFTQEMVREARGAFKINPRQCRLVYEILRLYHTNLHDKGDYLGYRLAVKRRLNSVYYKQLSDLRKLEKARMDTEWMRARLPGADQRLEELNDEYETIEANYKRVLEKLSK